jgi:hypothetical protein
MGELAILAQDVTKSDADRALYAEEFSQLKTMVSEDGGTTKLRLSIFRLIPTLRRLGTRLLSSRWTVRRQS